MDVSPQTSPTPSGLPRKKPPYDYLVPYSITHQLSPYKVVITKENIHAAGHRRPHAATIWYLAEYTYAAKLDAVF